MVDSHPKESHASLSSSVRINQQQDQVKKDELSENPAPDLESNYSRLIVEIHHLMASSSNSKGIYHVFLSFRGTDVRNNFLGHLYTALDLKGIYTYVDSEELQKGEQIESSLMKAIEESQMAVVVFSDDYASSPWCLDEVARIMECKKERGLMVYPVFYKVEPRKVRTPRDEDEYAKAMVKHEKKFGKDSEKVKRWKKALFDAGSLSGWELNDGNESEHIQEIVKGIVTLLGRTPLHVAKHPVGINSRVAKLKPMLHLESDDGVLMVGLWGKGGIGKTALAKAIYNDISRQFQGSCFLANVREDSKDCKALASLQEKLLSEILLRKQGLVVPSVDAGITIVREQLGCKKVLLILDDVNDLRQINALAGEDKWFGNGSRIIFTTRDKHLLTGHGIDQDHVYEVKPLDDREAHELLSKHTAFPMHQKLGIKTDMMDRVLHYAGGLPVALEVLGSFLCGRRELEWESTLKKLSRIPDKSINDVLKISFDGLEENDKEIFLHIACFFKGRDTEYIEKILQSCEFEPIIGLKVLTERSLLRIDSNTTIQMHDLIQSMGMDIVRQECRDDPVRRSRLWLYDDVLNVLQHKKGDCAAKAIVLVPPELKELNIHPNALMKMTRLRLLIVRNVHNSLQGSMHIHIPNELRWMEIEWAGCRPWIPKFSSGSKKLVGVDIRNGDIRGDLKQLKGFQQLKYAKLTDCNSLVSTPDISCTPNLEELHIENCEKLVESHQSIAHHDKLQDLLIRGCSEFRLFPNMLKSKNLRRFGIFGCPKFERFPDIPHKLEGLQNVVLYRVAIKELPVSIENLVSLKVLNLSNCKNLISLPSIIYNLQYLQRLRITSCPIEFPKYEDSTDPRMKIGLQNLYDLELADCNLSEVEFLENLSCFPWLRKLILYGNNITTLPASISKRNWLTELDVSDCHLLQEIPELPLHLDHLMADNCESLQTNGHLTSIDLWVNRWLNNVYLDLYDEDDPYPSVSFPGGEMPEWVQPVREGSVSFMASKDLYNKFLGLVFCAIVSKNESANEECSFEIDAHVNDERRHMFKQYLVENHSDHIWLQYLTLPDFWEQVDFGQIDGNYVKFGLTELSGDVQKWGFRIVCRQLEDDLKVVLREDQLINLDLLYEVNYDSTDSEDQSSLMNEESWTEEEDLLEDLENCQTSTENRSQMALERNHELVLPQGTQIPAQPSEAQLPTNSGEQANARTFSVGDSAAGEPEPIPINDPSATGSGTALALMPTMMPTTSTESMPFLGAAEAGDLPSAQLSTVAEELTSEISDIETSDLEAIDEILGVAKPGCERPLSSGSDSSTPGAVDGVRAKWEELYQLTKGGYSQIASESSVEVRIKNLLVGLSSGDDCFTKTPEFQYDYQKFAAFFVCGIETFRQNCDQIAFSTTAEESFKKMQDRLKAGKKILEQYRSSYQAAVDKKDELREEKERVEVLAEVERQIELIHIDIQREGKSMKRQFREVDATLQECNRQQAEVDRNLSIKRKCMEDNKALEERLSTFRRNVKRQLDDM